MDLNVDVATCLILRGLPFIVENLNSNLPFIQIKLLGFFFGGGLRSVTF
jgi:hypothetical protein